MHHISWKIYERKVVKVQEILFMTQGFKSQLETVKFRDFLINSGRDSGRDSGRNSGRNSGRDSGRFHKLTQACIIYKN